MFAGSHRVSNVRKQTRKREDRKEVKRGCLDAVNEMSRMTAVQQAQASPSSLREGEERGEGGKRSGEERGGKRRERGEAEGEGEEEKKGEKRRGRRGERRGKERGRRGKRRGKERGRRGGGGEKELHNAHF